MCLQDAFVKIVRTEGVSSLWSGLSPTLVLAVPATIVYFTTYEQLRQLVKDKQTAGGFLSQQPIWLTSLAIGGVARVWAVTLVSPLELIRTKMQSKKLSYNGTYNFSPYFKNIIDVIFFFILEVGVAIRTLVRQQGFFGLWQGLAPSLLRDVPFSGKKKKEQEYFQKILGC